MAPIRSTKQWLTLAAGHFFVALGLIGAFLPIIPTVPFLLLAAYFYNKGHPEFHHRLMKMPRVGPIFIDWDQHKIMRRDTKLGAICIIVMFFAWPLYFGRQNLAIILALTTVALALIMFVATRKSK